MNIEKNELVSVIIPVYNVEQYLENCVRTVINQTYSELEIILIDDGSTDKSSSLCDKLANEDDRITVVHKQNEGLGAARNDGIKISAGAYLVFIDSDDYISIDYVSELLKILKLTKSDLIISGYHKGEKLVLPDKNKKEVFWTCSANEALKDWHGKYIDVETTAWAKMYCRKLFVSEEGKLVNKYEEGRYYEDVPTTHKLIAASEKVTYTNKALYYYRINNASITKSNLSKKKIEDYEYAQKSRLKYFEKIDSVPYRRLFIFCCKGEMLNYCRAKYELKKENNNDEDYETSINWIREKFVESYKEVIKYCSTPEKVMFSCFNYFPILVLKFAYPIFRWLEKWR